MKYYRPYREITGKELCASTLASFMAAQFVDDPGQIRSNIQMPAEILQFLLRTAVRYWSSKKNGWLKKDPSNQYFTLTSNGLKKVQDRLAGHAGHAGHAGAQSVTKEDVLREFQVIRGFVRDEPLDEFEFQDPRFLGSQHNVVVEPTLVASQPEGHCDSRFLEVDRKIMADIWTRRGQPEFRARLLCAYRSRCAITSCEVEDALEAAHITPFAKEQVYEVSNGILLRSDIHTLFDTFLISIDPISWTVKIAPKLVISYKSLEGIKVNLPTADSAKPDKNRLLGHYREWQRRWNQV